MKNTAVVSVVLLLLSGCSSGELGALVEGDVSTRQIEWSDGDSGTLQDVGFRLRDVDAPETGGVGAAIGGAECERERGLGFLAKDFIITLTENASITVTRNFGPDRFGREVVDLSADGIDVARAGIEAGLLRNWRFDDNGDALEPKPDWCS